MSSRSIRYAGVSSTSMILPPNPDRSCVIGMAPPVKAPSSKVTWPWITSSSPMARSLARFRKGAKLLARRLGGRVVKRRVRECDVSGQASPVQVAIEELGYFAEGDRALRCIVFQVLRVRLAFKDKQVGMNPRLQQLLMHADGVAKEQIACAR